MPSLSKGFIIIIIIIIIISSSSSSSSSIGPARGLQERRCTSAAAVRNIYNYTVNILVSSASEHNCQAALSSSLQGPGS